jgi:hypothetical protein
LLLIEVGFTTIDENQGIGLAIVAQEVKLLESWWPVLVVLPGGGLVA